MNCESLIDRYLEHLHDGFYCRPTPQGLVLTTPFFGPDDDAIEVYIDGPREDGAYRVSDRGETLRYLNSFGTDFMRTPQRALHLQRVVRTNQAIFAGDEILAVAQAEHELPEVVDRLVHALREAAGLSHLLRTVSRPSFREQVATFLQQLPFADTIKESHDLPGAHSQWRVDFYLNGEINTVIEAITASTAGYAQGQIANIFMKFVDLHQNLPDLRAFALLDDQDGRVVVWPEAQLSMLRDQARVLPWTNRAELSLALASHRSDEMLSGDAHQPLAQ